MTRAHGLAHGEPRGQEAGLKRLAELPPAEQRAVAKKVRKGEADSICQAIDMVANSGLPEGAEPDFPGDDPGSNEEDPVEVYRDVLEQLPRKIELLKEHFDDVVANGQDPCKAVEVLQRAVDFFGELIAVEQELAAEASCE